MRTRLLPLALAVLPLIAAGCEKKTKHPGPSPRNNTVNLFGYEESQIHWMHYNIQRRGRVLLARFDPSRPDEMELLDCAVNARWEYVDDPAKHVEELDVQNEGELRARIPLGVARFSSYVNAGSALEFDYVTVGAYHLVDEPRVPRNDPDCADATHYVASLSVGAVRMDEMRSLDAGADVSVPGNVGGGGRAKRRKGKTMSWGDVDGCKQTDDPSCHTPMQMMLIPLADRYWIEESGQAVAVRKEQTEVQQDQVAKDDGTGVVSVTMTQDNWQPGYYMAMSLTKLLSIATYVMEETKYGLDGDGSALMGGYLEEGKPLLVGRPLKAGRAYMFFGASSQDEDVNIYVADEEGNIIARDEHDDSRPVLLFTPERDGNYTLALAMPEKDTATFGTMGIAVEDGFRVPPDMMQKVFQNMLDKGRKASELFANNGLAGAVFHDSPGDWAMQATILNEGQTITQNGYEVPAGRAALFMAVAHDMSMNLDLGVEDPNGQMEADTKPDAEPIVLLDPRDAETSYALKVQLVKASEPTLATALVLRDAK